jgi:hypothetical protein
VIGVSKRVVATGTVNTKEAVKSKSEVLWCNDRSRRF